MEDSERLHLAVTEAAENLAPDAEGAYLLRGAVLVSEWVAGDGTRQLTVVSTDAQGQGLTSWDIRGYAAELAAFEWDAADADDYE